MNNYIGLDSLSFQSNYELLTWNELRIGDLYFHIHSKDFNIKTGNHSYFNISEHTYHTVSKLLQEGDDKYKNFIRCSFVLSVDVNKYVVPDSRDGWRLEDEETRYRQTWGILS